MTRIMGEPFMGTWKWPSGYKPGDYVECLQSVSNKWLQVSFPNCQCVCQYRLEANHPYYMPPVWCLDKAAQLAGRGGWGGGDFGSQRLKKSIIAHARTLQNGCEPMLEPVDPLSELMWHEWLETQSFPEIAKLIRARFDITEKAK